MKADFLPIKAIKIFVSDVPGAKLTPCSSGFQWFCIACGRQDARPSYGCLKSMHSLLGVMPVDMFSAFDYFPTAYSGERD